MDLLRNKAVLYSTELLEGCVLQLFFYSCANYIVVFNEI